MRIQALPLIRLSHLSVSVEDIVNAAPPHAAQMKNSIVFSLLLVAVPLLAQSPMPLEPSGLKASPDSSVPEPSGENQNTKRNYDSQ